MARRNEWLQLKEEMIKAGFNVEVKGKSKNEYFCTNDYIIVDLEYNRGAYLDLWICDDIGNVTYYERLRYIIVHKIINLVKGETEYHKSFKEGEE